MPDVLAKVAVVVRSIDASASETGFLVRSTAAALSRSAEIDVWICGPDDGRPDGAFSPHGTGFAPNGATWPAHVDLGDVDAIVLDPLDTQSIELIERSHPGVPRITIGAVGPFALRSTAGTDERPIIPYVPINPIAKVARHNALGEIGYILVLAGDDRATRVEWLAAGLPRTHVVAVEDGMAHVFHHRSRVGEFRVDTRADLWRLMAHGALTVDLQPAERFGRECIESLRLGTPVVVPSDSHASHLVDTGAARSFDDVDELLGAARTRAWLEAARTFASSYITATYGDADWVVRGCRSVLTGVLR